MTLEGRSDGGLDEIVGFHVNGCCGFIQDEDASFTQEGTGEAQELSLSSTEVKGKS